MEQSSGTETRQTLTAEREGGERDQTDPGSREKKREGGERGREDGWRCEKDRERKGEEGVEREVSLFNNVDLEHLDMQHAACVFALVNQC